MSLTVSRCDVGPNRRSLVVMRNYLRANDMSPMPRPLRVPACLLTCPLAISKSQSRPPDIRPHSIASPLSAGAFPGGAPRLLDRAEDARCDAEEPHACASERAQPGIGRVAGPDRACASLCPFQSMSHRRCVALICGAPNLPQALLGVFEPSAVMRRMRPSCCTEPRRSLDQRS